MFSRAEGKTILIVSGYPALRRQLGHFARSAGLAVLSASSATQGLEIADAHTGSIDVLLSELRPAGMPGEEFLARVRERRPSLPALLLSPEPEEILTQVLKYERVKFLETPFSWSVLGDTLSEALSAWSAASSPGD